MARRIAEHGLPPEAKPIGSIQLRSYPQFDAPVPPSGILENPLLVQTDAQRSFRQRFGRSISLDRIENALRAAYRGSMRDLTDLSRETVDTDPHLASVLNKRFRALSSLPWEVVPATGPGVDRLRAEFYAAVAREQLRNMEGFRRMLLQQAWALFDGRAANELKWLEVVDGMSGEFGAVTMAIEGAGWIHPRRLSFGPHRELQIVDEVFINVGGNFTPNGIDVKAIPYKFVWWLPQLFAEYPEREGLAQRCLYWSFFKRFGARERMMLLELFGKPWRILEVDEDSTAGKEDLADADKMIDALGGSFTARTPRGTKLNVIQPQRTAGAIHGDVITESDRQLSKLVLGQTGTTDGVPSGLNNNQANVMQDEQLMILQSDAAMLSENIETLVTDPVIIVNFGIEAVTHAPRFVLRSDLPADRKSEVERLDGALKAGLAIARDEAYEISGFRIPTEDDIIIKVEQPPTPPLAPVPPAVRPVIVWPTNGSPASGEQQPPPPQASEGPGAASVPNAQVGAADAAVTITVNEDRASRGLDPLTMPDGALDPDGDLTIAEFESKRQTAAAPAVPAVAPEPDEPGLIEIAASALQTRAAGDQIAAHNAAVLLQIVDTPGAEEVDDPFSGEGGVHMHGLDRAQLTTALDGEHQHVFLLPDGRLMLTEFDGAHLHRLDVAEADDLEVGGEHAHTIGVDSITSQTGSGESPHAHQLQVFETALDGTHRHTLGVTDPDGESIEIESLSAGEFAALISEMAEVEPQAPLPDQPAGLPRGTSAVQQPEDVHSPTDIGKKPNRIAKARKRRKYATARGKRTAAAPDPGDKGDDEAEGVQHFKDEARTVAGQAHVALVRRGVDDNLSRFLTQAIYDDELLRAQWDAWVHSGCAHGSDVACVKDHRQPDSEFGNPETILDRGMAEARRSVAKLANKFKDAIRGLSGPAAIFGALIRARQQLDIRPVSRALERRMVQSLALGALDSRAEAVLDDPSIGEERIEDVVQRGGEIAEVVTSSRVLLAEGPTDFSRMRFDSAVRFFRAKRVVQRAEFDQLSALAKQRAFTVAGVMSDQMLATIQAELVRQIAAGAALDEFEKFIDTRLKDAGFLGRLVEVEIAGKTKSLTSAWHVETVYRTNVLNAYNAGRAAEMKGAIATRPVWEFRATLDSETRSPHRSAHGKMLLATDPFWQSAYPPFGFNCRCRVVSRGPNFLSKVVPGTTIGGLPDPGFSSGTSILLR